MLSNLRQTVVNFLKNGAGPTAVEYAVMLGVIIVIGITAYTSLSANTIANTNDKSAIKRSSTEVTKTAKGVLP